VSWSSASGLRRRLVSPVARSCWRARSDHGITPSASNAKDRAKGPRSSTASALELRQLTGWCPARSLPLFAVRRADVESFARELEAKSRARAPVTRRLCARGSLDRHATYIVAAYVAGAR